MKTFTVMGEHPGDGSVQLAENPIQALAKHVALDGMETAETIEESIRKNIEDGVTNETHYPKYSVIGDYEVKEQICQ